MPSQNEPLQECEARTALKKLGHVGADIEGVMPGLPRVPGGAGYLKRLGRLARGEALRLQGERALAPVGPRTPAPALMAVDMVAVWKIDDSAQGYLCLQAIDLACIMMAKHGEGALRLQP
jgi:hypothetical protein